MIEVFPSLYVGSGADRQGIVDGTGAVADGWFVISASKDPWHRDALGYTTRGAPKDHAEYLAAYRTNQLILNLVDVADPAYISESLMDAALLQIHISIEDHKVLVHCNQGLSRSPTIALLYLRRFEHLFDGVDFDTGVAAFTEIYPPYAPAKGMADYARAHW